MRTPEEQKAAIERSLTNIRPSDEGITRIEEVRAIAKQFAHVIVDKCPDSRGKSLALTKLEEAVMWATKSIVLEDQV
ncbi:Acb2/Tad1 domain-containing protein [Paenibacillus nuruki]|uniref:Acb2/Tad1 domain-containing protein n=1 Tax=Paenibacillus nuruki TaxID=1886670 RepID=UPI0028061373|nr:hypothetical protein [Paenibacillus nuruki]CAJ1315934.1 hypothetical protein AASFL403_11975 [Paenibacillus nuruki]